LDLAGGVGGLGGFYSGWKNQGNQCATLRLIAAGDLTAVVLNYAVHHAQAEARALANGLGGVEGIEHALRITDTRTGVGELQDDI